jgi:stress-induced morphogen
MLRRSLAFLVGTADIEKRIREAALLAPVEKLVVSDISGGCGSFFKVEVTSPCFEGKSLVQQHRMVHDALRQEIAEIHGITVVSKVPPPAAAQ